MSVAPGSRIRGLASVPSGARVGLLLLVAYAGVLVALRPATPFEWDEVLFQRALERYDVALHSPHPPGYPVYIAAARVLRVIVSDPLLALELVAVLAAVGALAVLWRLARDLGATEGTALTAAMLVAATPGFLFNANVGLSDVAGAFASLAAVWLVWRSLRVPRLMPLAAAAVALSLGVRPQLAVLELPVCVWLLVVTARERRWRSLLVSAGVGTAVLVACWLPAILLTRWSRFWGAVRQQGKWVEVTEKGYHLPGAPLGETFGHWFVDPFGTPALAAAFWILVAWGTWRWLRRGNRSLVALAGSAAGAYLLAALWTMNFTTAVRYVLPAVPFVVLLASGALLAGRRAARTAGATAIVVWCAAAAAWTFPALRERLRPAPVWAALEWVRSHANPSSTLVEYEGGDSPHVLYVLGRSGFRISQIGKGPARDEVGPPGEQTLFVTEQPVPGAEVVFKAPPLGERVLRLARGRYGTCAVSRMKVAREAVLSAEWQLRSDGWLLAGTGRIRLPAGATPALVRLCAGSEGLSVKRRGSGVEEVGAGRCELVPLLPGEAGEVEVSAPAYRPALIPAVQLLPLEALRPGGSLASAYMVPQVAHVAGYAGAFWRTDLVVMNPTSRPLRIAATFLPAGRANVEARSDAEIVPPGKVVLVPDVLGLPAFDGKGAVGAMLVRADEPPEMCAGGGCNFIVLARTYNSSAAPGVWRSAEWLPGVPASEALREGDRATFSHLTNTDRVGATVGVASWSPVPVRLHVGVFGPAGEPLAARSISVPPFGHARVGLSENMADGRVEVEVMQGGVSALVVPYAAMVDHETGFPIYVLPDALPPHPLPPGWWPPWPRPEAAR